MRVITRLTLLLVLVAICQARAEGQSPAKKTMAGVQAERDIPYIADGDPAQKLDVYLPEHAPNQPLPLIVWIHGGGWMGGSKNDCPAVGFIRRGYVVASVEHRFSQKAVFPAQIED